MSDKIIRLGGSHIASSVSIQNLKIYLESSQGRNFIVVSAVPELLELLEQKLSRVFHSETEGHELEESLYKVFKKYISDEPTHAYRVLVKQAASLLQGIALIGDYSLALRDQVISYAEKLTLELVKTLWEDAEILLPENILLRATNDFGSASFTGVHASVLESLLSGTYLIPGTYGITAEGKIARAGKTAADYTAAFLTNKLALDKLLLWDLDQKFYRTDPEIIADSGAIGRLTYAEASELAYFDHYSFHPRTVEPLEQKHIPIVVLDAQSSAGKVQTIINTETFVEDQIVKSVACTDDISVLKLDGPGVGLKPGILAKVTNCLNDAGLNIKSVITSQTSINFILNKENGPKARALVNELAFASVTEISLTKHVSLIGIIGHGMQHAFGVSAKIFTAVANNRINVLLSGSGASDLAIYLVVNQLDKAKSVKEIYKAFFNKKV